MVSSLEVLSQDAIWYLKQLKGLVCRRFSESYPLFGFHVGDSESSKECVTEESVL